MKANPVFVRFLSPIPRIYVEPLSMITSSTDSKGRRVGLMHFASGGSRQLRTLLPRVRALMKALPSEMTARAVTLDGSCLVSSRISSIGVWRASFMDSDFVLQVPPEKASCVLAAADFVLVIMDKPDGKPVGYAAFSIHWAVDRRSRKPQVGLEIDLDQVWLHPQCRGKGWSTLAAEVIAIAVRDHLDDIEGSIEWKGTSEQALAMVVGGDVYSGSGAGFVLSCHDQLERQFIERPCLRFDVDLKHEVRF